MYDFRNLSPVDFEALVADLLSEEMGMRFETFRKGRDNGIDIRGYSNNQSDIIIQCKHYADSKFSDLKSTIKNQELPKIHALNPKSYYIVTSLSLTPSHKDQLYELIKDYADSTYNIYGNEDVNQLLKKHPKIERNHFKLWLSSTEMLSSILNADIINLTRIEVQNIHQKIKLYVHNDSFHKALDILKNYNYVIISGIPGIGKTTLAEMLLYQYMCENTEIVKISSNISEALKVFRGNDLKIIYYDDFLGQTSLEEKLGKNEDANLLTMIKQVQKSKSEKIILTTREYILQQAKVTYEKLGDTAIDIAKCIVDLSQYNKRIKAEILYNHIYFSDIPNSFKQNILIDTAYLDIIDHRNYSPRIIEWMVNYSELT